MVSAASDVELCFGVYALLALHFTQRAPEARHGSAAAALRPVHVGVGASVPTAARTACYLTGPHPSADAHALSAAVSRASAGELPGDVAAVRWRELPRACTSPDAHAAQAVNTLLQRNAIRFSERFALGRWAPGSVAGDMRATPHLLQVRGREDRPAHVAP